MYPPLVAGYAAAINTERLRDAEAARVAAALPPRQGRGRGRFKAPRFSILRRLRRSPEPAREALS
jgi:hypothetical protein